MNFQINALDHKLFDNMFNLSDSELDKIYATRIKVEQKPGYPCRISLQDADIGEVIIAMPYIHHNVESPYKASGPIFIRENVQRAKLKINEIPEVLWARFLSIRAYDFQAMMIEATTTQSENLKQVIQTLFFDKNIHYLHIHNANPGCYSCSVERA